METLIQFGKRYRLPLIGILVGVLYGILARVVFGVNESLASVSFLFMVPAILGVVPLFFADDEQIRSYKNIIFLPWLTIGAVFFALKLVHLEEVLCLLILAAPFLLLGTLAAFVVRYFSIRRKRRRDRLQFSLLLILPFVVGPLEQAVRKPSAVYEVKSTVLVTAPAEVVWNNVVAVAPIQPQEYTPGIFQWLGIPKPIKATVNRWVVGGQRVGHFSGGLRFVETITQYQAPHTVAFAIAVDPASVGPRVFDQHVLNGNYFRFVEARYTLVPGPAGQTQLILTSSYQLTSTVNLYGHFWGNLILQDFQDRLLAVIQRRCDAHSMSRQQTSRL